LLIASHAPLLRLPYFWDEAGYYIPAARDLLAGSLIPHSTPSNAHPPLVLACLALCWKIFGQSPLVTRCAMLMAAAFSLLGFFRLARTVSNSTVATASTFLTAIYPVFFAQSSLAQVDLPAAGLIFWGLEAYVRRRSITAAIWFSLAALAKETAILVPLALSAWVLFCWGRALPASSLQTEPGRANVRSIRETTIRGTTMLLIPGIPLALWYAYHRAHTGFIFGNPEFFRYNVQATLHPLRIFLAMLLRLWQTAGYLSLYFLTVACMLAMRRAPLQDSGIPRQRIAVPVQLSFLAVAVVYVVTLSIIGGAVLARYMLPLVPLVILVCVSTIWRRLREWKIVLALVALAFVFSLFVNPPYGFSPEDNLAYRDFILLHQRADSLLETEYPNALVLTAWPGSGELTQPYLGYVSKPMRVVQIEDFTAEQLLSAKAANSRCDVALVFSTKYRPRHSVLDRWHLWQEWKTQYFGYHVDLSPEASATLLNGNLIYVERKRGQWIGVIKIRTSK
jgi:fumarate reductase subunit D